MRSVVPTINRYIVFGFYLFIFSSFTFAQEQKPTEPSHLSESSNSNAYMPHPSHSGMWMFEYKFMRMFQKGMLNGKDSIDPKSVLQNSNFKKLPYSGSHDCTTATDPCLLTNAGYRMNMDMHMLMAMYHQTRDLSWMIMLNYLSNDMDMYDKMDLNAPVTSFKMNSGGVGDVQLFLTNKMTETEWFDIKYTLGISLPFGSIDEPDGIVDMTGNQGISPYSMQLGSGTYDIITALAFEGTYYRLEYGGDIYRITRTGFNSQYYNLGDALQLKAWSRYTFPFGTQLRAGMTQNVWSPIEGRDERMSNNPRYNGGKRLDLLLGIGQKYKDFGIYMDYAYPLLQYLNGVQMKTTGILYLGVQYMYM